MVYEFDEPLTTKRNGESSSSISHSTNIPLQHSSARLLDTRPCFFGGIDLYSDHWVTSCILVLAGLPGTIIISVSFTKSTMVNYCKVWVASWARQLAMQHTKDYIVLIISGNSNGASLAVDTDSGTHRRRPALCSMRKAWSGEESEEKEKRKREEEEDEDKKRRKRQWEEDEYEKDDEKKDDEKEAAKKTGGVEKKDRCWKKREREETTRRKSGREKRKKQVEIVASYPIPFKKALSVKDPGYEASGDRGEGLDAWWGKARRRGIKVYHLLLKS